MTNQQLYITAGIPFFSILFVWIATAMLNRSAITALRSEMKAGNEALRSEMKAGFADVHLRIDDLRSEMKAGFADVHRRVDDVRDDLHNEMRTGFADLNRRINEQSERIGRIEKRLDFSDNDIRLQHERRLAILEARVLEQAS